jgi:enamine deaminase RidA (YjgF/YER057c/UK114 family)
MDNVEVLLGEAGASLSDVAKATLFVTDRAHLADAARVVLRRLEGVTPAFSAVVIKGLASPELLMEVDITADLGGRAP